MRYDQPSSLIFRRARPRSAFRPSARDLVLLADTGRVGEPDQGIARRSFRHSWNCRSRGARRLYSLYNQAIMKAVLFKEVMRFQGKIKRLANRKFSACRSQTKASRNLSLAPSPLQMPEHHDIIQYFGEGAAQGCDSNFGAWLC